MAKQWTDEERAAQADRCRQQQPWKHSTGPKSVAGKRKVSQNAPRKPASWGLDDALLAEAYRLLDEHDDWDSYRQLCHQACLVRRRIWRSYKARSRIKAWTPPERACRVPNTAA